MSLNNFKWPIVILVLVITLASLLGAQYIRNRHFVEDPLKNALLEIEGIEEIELIREGNDISIKLQLASVKDFATFHKEIDSVVKDIIKNNYTITVNDSPNDKLEAAYQKIHLALYEGISKGNYIDMGEYVERISKEYLLDEYKLTIREDEVFFQLHDNDNYIYRRIPRRVPGKEVVN